MAWPVLASVCARGVGSPAMAPAPSSTCGIDGFKPCRFDLRQLCRTGVRIPAACPHRTGGVVELLDDPTVAANLVTLLRTPPAARPLASPCSFCRAWPAARCQMNSANCCRPISPAARRPAAEDPCAPAAEAPSRSLGWMCFPGVTDPAAAPGPSMAVLALGAGWRRQLSRRRRPWAAAQLPLPLFQGGPHGTMRLSALQRPTRPGPSTWPWPTAVKPFASWKDLGGQPHQASVPGAVDAGLGGGAAQIALDGRRVGPTARLAGAADGGHPGKVMNQRCGSYSMACGRPRALNHPGSLAMFRRGAGRRAKGT